MMSAIYAGMMLLWFWVRRFACSGLLTGLLYSSSTARLHIMCCRPTVLHMRMMDLK